MSLRAAATSLVLLAACGDTGAATYSYPIAAAGPGPAPFMVGDWQVTLTRADVALGPIYFCATAAASPDLCDVAIAEYAEAAVVDALAEPQPIGEVEARPGDVRSVMLDYGISWFTTQTNPRPLATLGHSAILVGTATRGDETVSFDARVDVVPPLRGSPALVGVHATAEAPDETSSLRLELDPPGWLLGVDFDALAALGPQVTITAGDPAHAAIAFAMTTQPPSFRWSGD